jgi:hypothetical protein
MNVQRQPASKLLNFPFVISSCIKATTKLNSLLAFQLELPHLHSAHDTLSVAWTLRQEMLLYARFALLYSSGLLWLALSIWAAAIVLLPTAALTMDAS